jgi:hypothetical protein
MSKPTKLHEVQQLAGRVAALSRFVARLGERALPFYAPMKKSDKNFKWSHSMKIQIRPDAPKMFCNMPFVMQICNKRDKN